MKTLFTLILLLALAIPAQAQIEKKVLIKGKYGVDTYQVYYATGELKEQGTLVNGLRHGEYFFFAQDGQVRIKTHYKDGKEHGLRQVFNTDNQTIALIQYVEGQKSKITLPFSEFKEAVARKNK